MREILFRGKRKDIPGGWVYGWYQPPVKWGNHNFGTSISYFCDEGWLDDVEVIPETIGQFTGLTDKNGKKIFEGDVVRCVRTHCDGKEVVGHIIFRDCCFCVKKGIDSPAMDLCDDFEVIGNTYDNPELLEE